MSSMTSYESLRIVNIVCRMLGLGEATLDSFHQHSLGHYKMFVKICGRQEYLTWDRDEGKSGVMHATYRVIERRLKLSPDLPTYIAIRSAVNV